MQVTLNSIQDYSTHDGPGIRSTVFMKGCSCSCLWCQNPEGLHDNIETVNGQTYGYHIDTDEVVNKLLRNRIFYDKSKGGVTFSGGNPLVQINPLLVMMEALKKEGVHIALDVYGDCTWETLSATLPYVDLYLYDMKVMDRQKHREMVGVDLDIPLENLARLGFNGPPVLIRTPLIPGVNMDANNIALQMDFMSKCGLDDIELFPYHPQAEDKYDRMGWEYKMKGTLPPSDEEFTRIVRIFEKEGFNVKTS